MTYNNFFKSSGETSTEQKKFSYYKNGVRVKFPKKGPPLRIQILPSYNPSNMADGQGWTTCLSDGQPTSWFGMIQAAKFVGHGDWKSQLPILSLSSFEGKEPCPYLKLLSYCKNNPDWKYLVTKTGRFGAPDYQDAILKPVKSILLLNIIDVDNPGQGVQIGEFSYTVADSLLNMKTGLVFQRNLQLENYPNVEAALQVNPMLAYANGDITDPGRAPIFVVDLPPVRAGQFGTGYTIRVDVANGQINRRAASDFELSERYHLDDPESFLSIPTGQDIVDTLVSLLKGHKNALGIDETCAIKEAVGDSYRVNTVSAPGAVNSVQGFSPQPTVQTAPVYQQPSAGFAPNPALSQPAPQVQQVQPVQQVPPSVAAAAASQSAPVMAPTQPEAIPGEMGGADADLAASLAARMRSQMNMRR